MPAPPQACPPVQSPQFDLFAAQEILASIDEVTYKKKSPQDALTDLDSKMAAAVKDFQSSHPDWQGE